MRVLILGILAGAFTLTACGESNVMREIRKAEERAAAQAQEAQTQSEKLLADARARPNAETLSSGVVIEFNKRGSNQRLARPSAEAVVLVHYEGKLATGDVFDSSFARGQPAQFPLQGVVPGFAEAITHMRPGDEVVATLPAAQAYGAGGQPPDIPPNAALQFRIQLLAYQGADGRVVEAPRG